MSLATPGRVIAAAVLVCALGGGAVARGLDNVNNQADVNHPDIHDKVGDGTNANPNGRTNDGGGIHGIGNVPGQNGTKPNADGVAGFANQLDNVHGGIGDVNQNVGK